MRNLCSVLLKKDIFNKYSMLVICIIAVVSLLAFQKPVVNDVFQRGPAVAFAQDGSSELVGEGLTDEPVGGDTGVVGGGPASVLNDGSSEFVGEGSVPIPPDSTRGRPTPVQLPPRAPRAPQPQPVSCDPNTSWERRDNECSWQTPGEYQEVWFNNCTGEWWRSDPLFQAGACGDGVAPVCDPATSWVEKPSECSGTEPGMVWVPWFNTCTGEWWRSTPIFQPGVCGHTIPQPQPAPVQVPVPIKVQVPVITVPRIITTIVAPQPEFAPLCDPNQVNMSVSPNPSRIGDTVTFLVSGSQGSTWVDDFWSGGVTCSGAFWGSKSCTAVNSGVFTWTHFWRNTAPNNFNVTSPLCSKQVTFSVALQPQPTISPTPTPTFTIIPSLAPTVTPPSGGFVQIPTQATQLTTTQQCPSGTTEIKEGNSIVCVINTNVNNNQNSIQNNFNPVITVSPSPQVVKAIVTEATPSAQPKVVEVAGVTSVKELPKTGAPLAAWGLISLLPIGIRLRRFGSSFKKLANANFIWEERELKK